ncbi:MAG: potassium channel protein [Deltaproteobacteria bacterium]|nr:potassium channel protein [Deltaproteobacteria bacterium]
MFAFGTAGYMSIEGWGVLDALWMVVITLTTIGYGEVHPLSPEGKAFTILLIVSGLGVGTYAGTQLTWAVLDGDLFQAYRKRQRRRMMRKLNNHQIVVGYGRLGRIVTRELTDAGHPVAIIERDPAVAEEVAAQGIPVILGDGADDDCLREVGIERAQGVAITAAPVAEAIFVTLSARQLNPEVPILTRVESDEAAVKARRAGATGVVSPHIMGGWRMAHGLTRPHTTTFLDLATLAEHDDIMLDEIEVQEASGLHESTLANLGGRYQHGVLIVAIRRRTGEMVVTPQASTQFFMGDVLIVIGEPARVRLLNKVMRGQISET